MIVKLQANPFFNGELFKTNFIEGVSQEHVNQDTFDRLKFTLGLEPVVIEGDVECSKCEEYKKQIAELTKALKKAKKTDG